MIRQTLLEFPFGVQTTTRSFRLITNHLNKTKRRSIIRNFIPLKAKHGDKKLPTSVTLETARRGAVYLPRQNSRCNAGSRTRKKRRLHHTRQVAARFSAQRFATSFGRHGTHHAARLPLTLRDFAASRADAPRPSSNEMLPQRPRRCQLLKKCRYLCKRCPPIQSRGRTCSFRLAFSLIK